MKARKPSPEGRKLEANLGEMSKRFGMENLRELRNQWMRTAEVDRAYVSNTTVEQRVDQLIEMYRIFKPHLEETEEIFGPERRQAMAELQARIARLK